jgi:hypothetical protein
MADRKANFTESSARQIVRATQKVLSAQTSYRGDNAHIKGGHANRRMATLWPLGPADEASPTDHVYWLRRSLPSNAEADATTAKTKWAPVEYDEDNHRADDWFLATNTAERPRDVLGTESVNGSHHLRDGMLVEYWPTIDAYGKIRFEFHCVPKPFIVRLTGRDTAAGIYILDLLKSAPQLEYMAASGVFSDAIGEFGTSDGRGIFLGDIDKETWTLTEFPAYAVAHSAGVYDGKGYFFFDVARIAGAMFAVILEEDGGDNGTNTTRATYTYSATTLAGDAIGAGFEVLKDRILPGEVTAATVGIGYFNDEGTFVLWDTNEKWAGESCPEPE